MKRLLLAAAFVATSALFTAPAAHAELFAAKSNWGCLANQGGSAVITGCSVSRHQIQMPYLSSENVFYGPLRQNGQCLDIQGGRVLFAGCNGGQSQTWKFSGAGQLNNSFSCIVGSGNSLVVSSCPAAGAWLNVSSTRVISVPAAAAVPRGTVLAISGPNLINAATGAMVAAGGGNMVAAGGGNMVAAGGGNLVAAGGGNIVAGPNAANIVAAGGGN